MKRIIATLLLIFISSLILNNSFAKLNSSKNSVFFNKTYLNKDTLLTKVDTLKVDTLKVSKPKKNKQIKHTATWYHTHRHPRVHRNHPTAAYNFAPIGTKLRVINTFTGDTTIVEVTDRMGDRKRNKIDLSHMAFGQISPHGYGKIFVLVEIID